MKNMKKKLFGILLALTLCLALLPATALADTDTHANHCVCGTTHENVGDHKDESVITDWQEWTNATSLPTSDGNYYLSTDVTFDKWQIGNKSANTEGNITLCLNGHTITANNASNGDCLLIEYGTLTITDCQSTGKITGTNGKEGSTPDTTHNRKVIVVASWGNCTFNLYGGTITGIHAGTGSGGGVHNEGIFNMYGGKITGNTAVNSGGVYNTNHYARVNNGIFNFYGGTISGNTATDSNGGNDVYIYNNTASSNGASTMNANGGTVAGAVVNNGTIATGTGYTGTTFGGAVTNTGTISGGTYSGTVTNKSGSTVSGSVTNNGKFVFESGSTNDATITGTGAVTIKTAKIGTTEYDTLVDAVNAVPTDGTETTIVLLRDTTENIKVVTGQNIILDLNGKTLTESTDHSVSNYAIQNYGGTLTIKGNGIVQDSDGEDESSTIDNFGTLTIENGKFINTYGCNVVKNERTQTYKGVYYPCVVTIKNGTFQHDSSERNTHTILNCGTITIENGTFTSPNAGYALYNGQSVGKLPGVATIKGGTFSGESGAVCNYAATGTMLTIEGGTFNAGKVCCIGNSNATTSDFLSVKGGTFENFTFNEKLKAGVLAEGYFSVWNADTGMTTVSATAPTDNVTAHINSKYYYVGTGGANKAIEDVTSADSAESANTVTIFEAATVEKELFDGKYLKVTKGNDSATWNGCKAGTEGTVIQTSVEGDTTTYHCVATAESCYAYAVKDGTTTYYASLKKAIDGCETESVIYLNHSAVVTSSSTLYALNISAGKTLTIDLNGYDITATSGHAIDNSGTLTIQNSGSSGTVSATGTRHAAILNRASGSVTLKGGTYQTGKANKTDWYVIKNFGTMTIDGDVTVTKADGATDDSSLIFNGWADGNASYKTTTNDDVGISHRDNASATLTIKSGSFIGTSDAQDYSVMKNGDYGTLTVSGGTFSTDPSAYAATGYIGTKNDDGTYGVVVAQNLTEGVYATDPSGSLAPGYYVSKVENGLYTVSRKPIPSKPAHDVDVKAGLNGSVTVNQEDAREGTVVTVTVAPNAGYVLDELTVVDASGNAIAVTSLGGGKYSFIMPDGDVVVRATFTDGQNTGFVDVPADKYFYNAVNWAVANGITSGTDATHFAPYASCTRGQLVTFLWRAAGQPAAKATENAFSDVKESSSFYKAILWAAENGIVTGYSDGTFQPNKAISRQQTAAILYRYAKVAKMDVSVGEDTNILSFNDAFSVSEYAISAFQWATGAQVITGNKGNLLPYDTCTRAQIVTMLYRLLAK